MFIVEITTTTGPVCERFATYDEAKRRVEAFPLEALVGIPFIFEELPDGSQRVVREDGKPLQAHRLPYDGPPAPDEAIPVAEGTNWDPTTAHRRPDDDDLGEPIPLVGDE